MRLRSVSVAAAVVLPLAFVWSVSATTQQRQEPRHQMPMYDAQTETKFTGTIEAVDEHEMMPHGGQRGRGRMGSGVHFALKTVDATLEVHVGPASFLATHDVQLAEGDEVEVLGSRVDMAGREVIIAREIKAGGQTLVLRDENGTPRWSRGRHSRKQ